jgi:hypothetical protein
MGCLSVRDGIHYGLLTIGPLGCRAIGDRDGDKEKTETEDTQYQTDSVELPEQTECLGFE